MASTVPTVRMKNHATKSGGANSIDRGLAMAPATPTVRKLCYTLKATELTVAYPRHIPRPRFVKKKKIKKKKKKKKNLLFPIPKTPIPNSSFLHKTLFSLSYHLFCKLEFDLGDSLLEFGWAIGVGLTVGKTKVNFSPLKIKAKHWLA